MNKNELEILKRNIPEHPGIHGRDNYLNAAVLVPLVHIDGEYHFLFEKRAEGIKQGKEICFPGGKYSPETDKTRLDTAIRETMEELGIPRERVFPLGQMDSLIAPVLGGIIDPFLAEVKISGTEELDIQKDEVEKAFLVPVSWFQKNRPEIYHVRIEAHPRIKKEDGDIETLLPSIELGLPDSYSKPWVGRKHRILVYRVAGELVWGLTAEMVNAVVDMIEKGPCKKTDHAGR